MNTLPAHKALRMLCLLLGVLLISCGKKKEEVAPAKEKPQEAFLRLMNSGKNYLDSGDAQKALSTYQEALRIDPVNLDLQLNLANTWLALNNSSNAARHASEAIALDHNSAAAHYLLGLAHLRESRPQEAVKSLQISRDLDPTVPAVSFQLGIAQLQLKLWEEAIDQFLVTTELETNHPAAFYNLSQAYMRTGLADEAAAALQQHQQIAAALRGPPPTGPMLEKSRHTQPRVPFQLEQPSLQGVSVVFSDATAEFFPNGSATNYFGPFGIIDIDYRGANDLFVLERSGNFRLLLHTNKMFQPVGESMPALTGTNYSRMLVADLQNDRIEDVIVLGENGSQLFKFATNGVFTDASQISQFNTIKARDGALADLDFTGKLDLILVGAETNQLKLFRNYGNLFFAEITSTSGIPAEVTSVQSIMLEDWNNDDLLDIIALRKGEPPLLLEKERGGPLVPTNRFALQATATTSGDFNNDLRPDLLFHEGGTTTIIFGGITNTFNIGTGMIRAIHSWDYDNDGWLDLLTVGDQFRLWRNQGQAGFKEVTAEAGLGKIAPETIVSLAMADLDHDADSDLLLMTEASGFRVLKNDGSNKNHQLKVRLVGNRSNSSGLGVKLELTAGAWRTVRTIKERPIEIGTGKYGTLESVTVRWFDLAVPNVDVKLEPTNIVFVELILPTGSCPYLYAWDGKGFRFVTDLLGAAPLGLPVKEGRYIEADSDEYVWVGNESTFPARNGHLEIQITEELREILYLDTVSMIVVDHPPGTEVYPTSKLLPGRPFPPPSLVTLHKQQPLLAASDLEGRDVTAALLEVDEKRASPAKLKEPQLRGWAEPHGVILDFGPLDSEKPLVLALTGWLRFGGGMANISASHRKELGFPFPVLEGEMENGWEKIDVTVGAPAGKTKRLICDLTGKLKPGMKRLRLTAQFEIHWDQIALMEKFSGEKPREITLLPGRSDLHWRGFSFFENRPWSDPLTPDYGQVFGEAPWRIHPTGWVTRYGEVQELILQRDNALALISGGDELSISFDISKLPMKQEGWTRDYFLYCVGWDKDADFHVAEGRTVEPMPFHGMDYQRYGKEPYPADSDTLWKSRYNTRWVGPRPLERSARQSSPAN
ncbi:MAG: FG-GAP-like repeat-containing protein [Verrucomicrobiota bacterium]|nr:FG-GAP-like repeat-containing protein [Verrucomicrobiota bacterium]